jgi:hypothetical protein
MSEDIEGIKQSPETDITRIAQDVFGSSARVESMEEIRQSTGGGVPRIIGCNWNLSYIVALAGHESKYVFRFNRRRYGRDDKAIVQETQNNALIAAHTDVPTPTIHHMDVSHEFVATGYIVMDYMIGEDRRYLTHPHFQGTTPAEKEQITWQVGMATAKIHTITEAATRAAGAGICHGLDALERVITNSNCEVTPARIEACRQIALADPALVLGTLSWSVGDAGIHLAESGSEWKVSFICDLEYQGYADPLHDLAPMLCHPEPMWSLKEPLSGNSKGALADAFFDGYEQIRPIDHERLGTVAVYAHLGIMCGVAREAYKADDGPGIEDREPPIYSKLLAAIEQRG